MMPINSTSNPDRAGVVASPRTPRFVRSREAGFSLIELMIAVVLGLLVVAGLINLFIANRKAYQVQSGNNFLQENLRIVSDRMGWSLRMADYWGGNSASTVTVNSSASGAITALGNCNGTWATSVNPVATNGGGVFGYTGGASFPFDATCIGGAANYVHGSDVLVVRYADPQTLSPGPAEAGVTPAESATISGNANEVFLLSIPSESAQLFAGTVPTTTTVNIDRYANPYQVEMYYLRPCSVLPAGSSVCTAAADGGSPLPTLMRMHLQSDGTFVSEPVIDGIEQMKFAYGVMTGTTNTSPSYMTAAAVTTANEWANVVSVRIAVVAVNPTRDITVPHVNTFDVSTDCTYTINNGSAATVTACANFTPYGNNPWQFARTSQQFVVQLRNRTASLE